MYATGVGQNIGCNYPKQSFLEAKDGPSFGQQIEQDDQPAENQDPEKALVCARCENSITASRLKIQKNNSHQHTFFNPQGIVFTLGCFSIAPGCKVFGEPSTEFSWFEGYSWSFAVCSYCHEHLGWFFQSVETDTFFGLILMKLLEK